ncbi:MAG: phytanoyl-CoA dioxygenase family protein [Myxococcota bacterium]
MSDGASAPDPRALAALREDGYCVLPDLLAPERVASFRAVLAPLLDVHPTGRRPFEGLRTQRVYALLTKCPEMAALVEHPALLGFAEATLTPGFLLSSLQAVHIQSGEAAQDLHCDDDAGAPPRPRAPQGISGMWALEDFTSQNGGTRLVPGSHRWGPDRQPESEDIVSVEMPAGSLLVYLGGVLHGGGAHREGPPRLGVSVIYTQPWLRQFENLTVATPPAVAAQFSERIQRMLGYSLLFALGNVDGRDPIHLVRDAASERSR